MYVNNHQNVNTAFLSYTLFHYFCNQTLSSQCAYQYWSYLPEQQDKEGCHDLHVQSPAHMPLHH